MQMRSLCRTPARTANPVAIAVCAGCFPSQRGATIPANRVASSACAIPPAILTFTTFRPPGQGTRPTAAFSGAVGRVPSPGASPARAVRTAARPHSPPRNSPGPVLRGPQRGHRQPDFTQSGLTTQLSTAFCVCSRFSASSKIVAAFASNVAASISLPR